jgi:hypothetical protein
MNLMRRQSLAGLEKQAMNEWRWGVCQLQFAGRGAKSAAKFLAELRDERHT